MQWKRDFRPNSKFSVTFKTFDGLFNDKTKSNAVQFRTIGQRQWLSLPKERPKDFDITANKTINNLTIF